MAPSDEALEAWMASKINRRPLVRTMSALDGFVSVTAAVTGPRRPQDWMCPLMGLPRDVLAKGPVGRSKSPGYGHLNFPHLMIVVIGAEPR